MGRGRRESLMGGGVAVVTLWMMVFGRVRALAVEADGELGLCETLVSTEGYICEEYTFETEDGYLVGVQHLPFSNTNATDTESHPVVFLQHGLFAGADNWIYNGVQESLSFILVDAGFDVWLGNVRGVQWSHGHKSLSVGDSEFWNFSFDELAAKDLPAMLDFVHSATNSMIYFIGHSQGTMMLTAGLATGTSEAQHMADLLTGAVLIGPVAYMQHVQSKLLTTAAKLHADK